jgi:Zn finger protein HypA/HybF involved in hydrogenase expression
MGVLTSVKEFLAASTESPNRGEATAERSKGAYWCHDCSERIRDVEVEGESPPDCSVCGEEMDFERSPDSTGCAC